MPSRRSSGFSNVFLPSASGANNNSAQIPLLWIGTCGGDRSKFVTGISVACHERLFQFLVLAKNRRMADQDHTWWTHASSNAAVEQ